MKDAPESVKKDAQDDKGMLQDQFVYLIWSNLVFAKLFFARFLPQQLLLLIELDSLELGPTHMTSREGVDSFGDIFYKFRFKSGKRGIFVLLIEHKSYYDRFVSLQILRYEAGIFEQMEKEPEKYADQDGLLPVPYSILLCQKPCPQFDDVVSKCEGLDYGIRTRFQEICFNKIDVDALLDEPLLCVALGLARFAGYKDAEKENRRGELLTLFRSLANIDPTKRENLKETWEFIFEVSLNYLSKITRNISFSMTQFRQELSHMEGGDMQTQLYDDVFEEFFYDKVQPYKDAVAAAESELAAIRAKVADVQAEVDDVRVKYREAEARSQEAEARSQEATSRAEIIEELFYSTMYETICDALCERGKVENVPRDVLDKLERIKSYSFLRKLLSISKSRQSDYAAFLKLLDEGARQEKDATL